MQLATTRAIVTGGVSGLGLAVAKHLVAHGGKVALFDVNDDKGAAAVAELGADKARYFKTDVTDEAGFLTVQQLGGVGVKVGDGATAALGRLADPPALRRELEAAVALRMTRTA